MKSIELSLKKKGNYFNAKELMVRNTSQFA